MAAIVKPALSLRGGYFKTQNNNIMHTLQSPYNHGNIIQDLKSDWRDNVPSEDFDPGYGCVPVSIPYQLQPLPIVEPDPVERELWLWDEHNRKQSEAERNEIEDAWLAERGVK